MRWSGSSRDRARNAAGLGATTPPSPENEHRERARALVAELALAGDTPTELLALAGREAVELIVPGAGHARWREMPVLGRTTRIVLHEAPCSVLLVHRWRPDREHAHALVGTDGSAEAEHAVEVFASFADPARCRVLVASATSL